MKKYYIMALAALAMAFSCSKNAAEQIIPEESVGKTITVTCDFAQPDTKVAIDDSNGKTTWEVGDEILIHGEKTSENVTVTLASANIINSGKTATFTVTLPETPWGEGEGDAAKRANPNGYYAAYPASAYMENSSGKGYHYNTFSETNLPLMSASYNAASQMFTFHNLCGAISFIVSGTYDSYVLVGNEGETVGYSKYAVKTSTSETNYKHSSTAGSLTSVTGAVISNGTTPNVVYFPNGVDFTSGFTLYLKNGSSIEKQLVISSSTSVARNKYRPMGNVTAYLKDYVAPSSHASSISTEGATVLDGAGTANSYIISGASGNQVYTFKAYKGNSTTGVGTVASASILWETYNDDTAAASINVIEAVDFEKKSDKDYYTMVFKMPATVHAGNALIAAKDAVNNILWSWHIWVPDPSSAITLVDEPLYSSKKTMSRNLGALVDADSADPAPVSSYGLLYEWGRKDPFLGSVTVAGTAISSQTTRMTIEESIQHPTVYVNVSGKAWTPSATATTADGSLWGETTKTIYDPCPVGYMLPQRASTDFWGGSEQKSSANLTVSTENNRFAYGNLVFPFAGYIDDGSDGYKKATLRTILWSGRWDSGTENGYGFYAYLDSDGPSYKRSSISRCRGGSVRCVAE